MTDAYGSLHFSASLLLILLHSGAALPSTCCEDKGIERRLLKVNLCLVVLNTYRAGLRDIRTLISA